jgi:hypothetical protein
MAVTPDYVREVFKGLENGDGAAFFTHAPDAKVRLRVCLHKNPSSLNEIAREPRWKVADPKLGPLQRWCGSAQ